MANNFSDTASPALLFVNYHYIRDPAQYIYPWIHPIAPDDFTAQVDWLSDRFHMASPEEAQAYISGQASLPSDSVVLTFDDGLMDQYRIAVDVLDPRGIKGIFFVTSQPLTEGHANTLQKTHWLRAMTEPGEFQVQLLDMLQAEWRMAMDEPASQAAAEGIYIYDDPDVGRVKYLINFLLPESLMDELSSGMLADRGVAEADFCTDMYMSERNVQELHRSGHIIGAHGHRHIPFTRIPDGDTTEIETNTAFLSSLVGKQPEWVSYPFGRDWAIPDDPESFCRHHGFRFGLTLTQGWNVGTESPYLLKRVNTNEVEMTAQERLQIHSQENAAGVG